jgi:hypothetical protein
LRYPSPTSPSSARLVDELDRIKICSGAASFRPRGVPVGVVVAVASSFCLVGFGRFFSFFSFPYVSRGQQAVLEADRARNSGGVFPCAAAAAAANRCAKNGGTGAGIGRKRRSPGGCGFACTRRSPSSFSICLVQSCSDFFLSPCSLSSSRS